MTAPDDLGGRVTRLEQRLSRLRIVSVLAFVVAAAGLAWGLLQRHDAIAEGSLWLAKDGSGRIRASFGVSNDGAGLTVWDSTGQLRLDVGVAPGGVPGILLVSKRGEPAATLNAPDGSPAVLRLTSVAESTRVELTPRSGTGGLQVRALGRPDTTIARRP